jgi:DTW domain-containing protein YfiP
VGQRSNTRPRCAGCGLHLELCACPSFGPLATATPLAVVQHPRERGKPTNTGRLLQRWVRGTPLLTWPLRDQPFDPGPLTDPGIDWHVLYPREDAPVLDAAFVAERRRHTGRAVGFVLLDGTWHQCTRMTRRVPIVQDLPCVALPPGPPSCWTGRTQHDPRGLSTVEAGLRVLALVDDAARVAPLLETFAVLAARLDTMRGHAPPGSIPWTPPGEHARLAGAVPLAPLG